MSSPPTSGFWQSSGLVLVPARQQVSHLAGAGGTAGPLITGDHTHATAGKTGFISRISRDAGFPNPRLFASSKRPSMTTLSRRRGGGSK